MFLSLLAITVALLLIISSNALSLDTSVHLARHQHIAARHPAVKRSVSARCQERGSTSAAAASSTSSTAPPSSQAPQPSSSPSSGTGKVGLAWAYGGDTALQNFITDKVSTIYTWTAVKPPNIDGLQYAPMLWGSDQLGQFQSLVKPGYANIVLAFNEPDLASQSNLDPKAAAAIWMANGDPLRRDGYLTIAPAIAFSIPWLQSFFTACEGCKWTAMAAHIYATDPQDMIDYLTTLHNTFNMDIWVTEFACESFTGKPQCDDAQAFAFMTTVTQWMDDTVWIAKYFAYGLMTADQINIAASNALMETDGTPTALGKLYIGA